MPLPLEHRELNPPKGQPQPSQAAIRLFSLGITIALFGFLCSTTHFWKTDGIKVIPSGSYAVGLGVLLVALAIKLCWPHWKKLQLDPIACSSGLLLVFFFDFLSRTYSFYLGPLVRGEIIFFSLLCGLLLRQGNHKLLKALFPISIILMAASFLIYADGRLLFSDDHSVVFFRLNLLKEHFPHIPFYYPLWNGGMDARDFFATGSLNFFLLLSPLIYSFDLQTSYTFLVALILFGLLPGSFYLAAKIERLPDPAPHLAGILAMATSLLWYRWALKYGTMGFITSSCLIPLNLAWCSRILSNSSQINKLQAIACVCSITLMLLWSPSALVFIPASFFALGLAFHAIFKHQQTWYSKQKYALRVIFALLLINAPWIIVMSSVSKVFSFLKSEKPSYQTMAEQAQTANVSLPENSESKHFRGTARKNIDFKRSIKLFREDILKANPLILILCLSGLALFPCKLSTRLYQVTSSWLLFIGCVLAPMKPQLELDRMLLILVLLMVIPTALSLHNIFSRATAKLPVNLIFAALCGGFLCCSILCSAAIVRNRSLEQYAFAEPIVDSMSQALQKFSDGARILFAGCVLHELSNAHLAPLTVMSQQPLVASSQFHDIWRYRDVIPAQFLAQGEDGIFQYLDLYNVGAVMVHDRKWREFYRARPGKFQEVWKSDNFMLFKRLAFESSYFLKGNGKIIDQTDRILKLSLSTEEAVLKFNYFPFLKSNICTLEPYAVTDKIQLIKLSNCPLHQEIQISARSAWSRVLHAK